MRAAAPGDYQVQVEGVGPFTFARRPMRDEFAMAAEYSRLTEGVDTPTAFLDIYGRAFSTIKVLQVSAPAGWSVDTLDPQEDASYAQLIGVYNAIRASEADFRRRP